MSLIDRLLHNNARTDDTDNTHSPADNAGAQSARGAVPADARDPDMQAMLREIEEIQDVIGPEDGSGDSDERVAIRMSITDVLAALPAVCRSATAPDDPTLEIEVLVRDPFAQLATGRVTTEVADLIRNVPNGLLSDEVGNHLSDIVPLPLAIVVAAVSPDALKKRTATTEREPSIHRMPDLFNRNENTPMPPPAPQTTAPAAPVVEPVEEPEPAAVVPEPTTAPPETKPVPKPVVTTPEPVRDPEPVAAAPEPVRKPEPVVAAPESVREPKPVATAPVPESQPEPTATTPEPVREPDPIPTPAAAVATSAEPLNQPPPRYPTVLVSGVDLNNAPQAELVDAFEGVGPKMAQRIMAARPFGSALALSKVQGVGRAMYERITGERLPYGTVNMEAINAILGDPTGGMPKLDEVAEKLVALPGVAGCILSHSEGYLLASAWKRGKGQSVGAIAPQIFKHIGKYFQLLQMRGPESIALFVPPRPLFITHAGDVFLIAFMARSRMSSRRLTFIETLTSELVKRLKGTTG